MDIGKDPLPDPTSMAAGGVFAAKWFFGSRRKDGGSSLVGDSDVGKGCESVEGDSTTFGVGDLIVDCDTLDLVGEVSCPASSDPLPSDVV